MNRSRGYDDDRNTSSRRRGFHHAYRKSFGGRSGHRGRGGGSFKRRGGSFSKFDRKIDRRKTCPLLLRAFPYDEKVTSSNTEQDGMPSLRKPDEYATHEGLAGMKECRLYTWKDATLGELADMIRKDMGRDDVEMKFSLVYPDARGRMVMRKIGNDMTETLERVDFQIGDYLDVCCRVTPASGV